jgi:acetylornithine deacetylase
MTVQRILEHLEILVAMDTQNPPRAIDADSDIFKYCSQVVGSTFAIRVIDYGGGHVSWYATRGNPRVLFNVHLDTVPVGEAWSSDPLEMKLSENRAYGRGTCDIKGAAACLLTLAEQGAGDLAILFTTDEEGAGGCCVQKFVDSGEAARYGQVIVAEPTACQAILSHRGFLSVKTRFRGIPGHSSEARALADNAAHQFSRWAANALGLAEKKKLSADDPGACFNLGVLEGGTKANVIAASTFVHWSARLRPGESNEDFLAEARACAPEDAVVEWQVPFAGSPLPAAGQDDSAAAEFAARHEIDVGQPVDFWTEASIFSSAGIPALVLGPGNIAQAHAADEWVALDQLETAYQQYAGVVGHGD